MLKSVCTDGLVTPRSTCETWLGSSPSLPAISRTPMPAASRARRRACPSVAKGSSRAAWLLDCISRSCTLIVYILMTRWSDVK